MNLPVLFALFCAASFHTSSLAAEEIKFEPNVKAAIFDSEKVAIASEYGFEISESGQILDGPQQGLKEPEDYSVLLKDEELAEVFSQSLYGCYKAVRHCILPEIFRWNTKALPTKIFQEGNSLTFFDVSDILSITKDTIGVAGFELPPVEDEAEASLVFYVGSVNFLALESKHYGDEFGVAHFKEYYANEMKGDDRSNRDLTSCYVSTFKRSEGRVAIFFTPFGFRKCLPQSLLVAVGLNETGGYFPSVTGSDYVFRKSTNADIAFLNTLYHPDFPTQRGVSEVKGFFLRYINENPIENLEH